MPEMHKYIVQQTREIHVDAASPEDAAQIAYAVFRYGQDSNGLVEKKYLPNNVFGNTCYRAEIIETNIKRTR